MGRAVYSTLSIERQSRRDIDPSDMMRLQFFKSFLSNATFNCIAFIFPLRLQRFNFGPGEITWGQFCKSLQKNPFLCVAVSLFASFCKQPTKNLSGLTALSSF